MTYKPQKLNGGIGLQNIEKAEMGNVRLRVDTTFDVKQYITTVPTHIPKNFYESIVFYDDGTNRRLYLYINNTWRYVALT